MMLHESGWSHVPEEPFAMGNDLRGFEDSDCSCQDTRLPFRMRVARHSESQQSEPALSVPNGKPLDSAIYPTLTNV